MMGQAARQWRTEGRLVRRSVAAAVASCRIPAT
eukprot:CAMPEP_0198527810 /NCGR_PEP_ID=MMETSP1462-20131121/24771_1 /TAXON_ID=1333877 /ORGANISM="Brandtodinium nutriculum, Strain RCC3387" /LENGTH=32 /DNA_ID= /DNA_START= /DNA_END= /DNA_ORIENTATION=